MAKFLNIFVVVAICSTARSKIVRPCNLTDYNCIGYNLGANSKCNSEVRGYLPEEYTVKQFKFNTPYFNATYIDKDLIVKNHDKCQVSEFFFNTETKKAVLTMDCRDLDLESDRVLIQHKSKREDAFFNYHIHATYPLIRMTVNLDKRTMMDLCGAHVFTEVVYQPYFHIDPKDKPTKNFLSKDLSALMIFEREAFYYGGHRLAMVFIESLICDYGCKRVLPHHNKALVSEV